MNGFEAMMLNRDVLAKSYVALIPSFDGDIFGRPFYDSNAMHYMFMGEFLSRNNVGNMRDQVEVLNWLESTLVNSHPAGDWDNDGTLNFNDINPFGIE